MLRLVVFIVVIGTFVGALMPAREGRVPAAEAKAVTRTASGAVRLERLEDGHFYVHGEVNGQLARFLVDTGASMVALTMEDAERLGVDFSPSDFEVVGTGASGPVRGQRVMLDKVIVEGREAHQVEAAVLEGLTISLLGQSFLTRLGSIEMSGDYMLLN
jgi:aspartyl protease family protein